MTACKGFLDLKPTNKITADALLATEAGVDAFLANLYYNLPIEDFAFAPGSDGFHWNYKSANHNGRYAWILTDDGFGSQHGDMGNDSEDYNYWNSFTNSSGLHVSGGWELNNNNNLFFSYIDDLTSVDEQRKDELRGQAWFVRAMTYFALARRYGGVPKIEKIGSLDDSLSLWVPRMKEVETWDYVLHCFDEAAKYLSEDKGNSRRANKWVALAYKSRAALHAGALAQHWNDYPLEGKAVDDSLVGGFSDDDMRRYYQACIDASAEIIKSGKYSLYKPEPATDQEATDNIIEMFQDPNKALCECIFIKGFAKGVVGHDYGTNQDNWGNPCQTAGSWIHPGRLSFTLEFVENFEDKAVPGQRSHFVTYDGDDFNYNGYEKSYNYKHYENPTDFFAGKDPRLPAVVILPGSYWKNGNVTENTRINIQGGLIKPDGTPIIGRTLNQKEDAIEKGGVKYYPYGGDERANSYSGFALEGGNYSRTGFLMRKYLSPTYKAQGIDWDLSTTDWCDIRYAEVLLNYVEAVYESGLPEVAGVSAEECLNATRHRAHLSGNIVVNQDNIRGERRAELSFDNTRNWDFIRWRLWSDPKYDGYIRGALVPVMDLREAKPSTIFIREYVRESDNSYMRPTTRNQRVCYYKSIPGITTNHLIQNPGW